MYASGMLSRLEASIKNEKSIDQESEKHYSKIKIKKAEEEAREAESTNEIKVRKHSVLSRLETKSK